MPRDSLPLRTIHSQTCAHRHAHTWSLLVDRDWIDFGSLDKIRRLTCVSIDLILTLLLWAFLKPLHPMEKL